MKLRQRPYKSPVGVIFKFSDEHSLPSNFSSRIDKSQTKLVTSLGKVTGESESNRIRNADRETIKSRTTTANINTLRM